MNLVTSLVVLTFLVIFQIAVLPWNLAFAVLIFYNLFIEQLPNLNWLIVVALLVSIFGNLNPGIVLIAFTAVFLAIDLSGKLIPNNRLTKSLLVIISIPLTEFALLFVQNRVF